MNAVFRKELKSWYSGFMGYLFAAVLLIGAGIYTMVYNLQYQAAMFEYVFGSITFLFLILIPVLTMRIYPEEKKQNTDKLLYSLPLKMSEIVAGKYFAALCVLAVPTAIICLYPAALSFFGTLNFKIIYCSAAMFFLLGAALISVCSFISSLFENQILAAIVSFIVVFLNYFLSALTEYVSSTALASSAALGVLIILLSVVVYAVTKNVSLAEIVAIVFMAALCIVSFTKSSLIEGLAPAVLEKLSLFDCINNTLYGNLSLSEAALLISVAFLFNFLTVQVLERKRWA